MFDTMTMTKLVGGLCGTFLVFLLGGWAAELIYHGAGGHKDGDHAQGYVIEVAGADHGGAPVEAGPAFEEVYATADAAAGAGEFRPCAACHSLESGENGLGPYLYGIVGRNVGSVDGFGYSGSLSVLGEVWTPEALNAFLENPKSAAPGTSMNFRGLAKVEDRANLIAYLDSLDN